MKFEKKTSVGTALTVVAMELSANTLARKKDFEMTSRIVNF